MKPFFYKPEPKSKKKSSQETKLKVEKKNNSENKKIDLSISDVPINYLMRFFD